jgi:AI-2 transport protein TqsA
MNGTQTEQRIQTICLIILCAMALVLSLYWLKQVVVPFVWAVFLTIILKPFIRVQKKYLHLPKGIAIVVTLLLVFALLTLVGGLIASSVRDFAADARQYEETIERMVKDVGSMGVLKKLGIELPEEIDFVSLVPTGTIRGVFVTMTNAMMGLLSRAMLVMLFAIFLLVGSGDDDEHKEGVADEMTLSVKQYISTKVTVSAVTGLLVFVVLWLLGVPYAISFGAFAFILNFIPSIGSIISTLLPLPVLLFNPAISTVTLVLAIAVPGSIQLAVGNAIEPKMMGQSLDLHPVTVLIALIFWGMLWGFEGMILGVPITVIVKIILEKLEMTAPVAHLMAGRFPGSAGA